MGKLAPPLLEGTVPAFYSENGIAKIAIPFSMNRAVSKAQVKGIAIKVKTSQGTSSIYSANTLDEDLLCFYDLETAPWVEFYIPEDAIKFNIGQFYKVQLAYISSVDGSVGYYSTVGVTKCTAKPEISIEHMHDGKINSHIYEYQGIYRQEKDTPEKVYSYRFDVYDPNDNLVLTSGDLIHNSDHDADLYETYDTYVFPQELSIGDIYKIKYTVTTLNKLTISTPRYRVMQKPSIDPEIKATLDVTLNYDNGYIAIKLVGEKIDNMEEPTSGAFLLTRACDDSDFGVWDEITRFKLAGEIPSRQLWKDFTVEQGKTYRYSLQQYNDKGLYSNRIYSDYIYSDFEDAFLFDGQRQLKIKYNPKITNFKTNLLETKTNTIGGKHPFIFRNGRVYYNEFAISGLVSYQMDEENLFLSEADYLLEEKTTNLVSENIASERIFKLKVLEWLNNGKPKVFRSPGEGNYIVYLMNTSLAPNDTLGRMLHTFSTTASEVADFNYKNLSQMDFIKLKDPEVATLRFETVNFYDIDEQGVRTLKPVLNQYEVLTARFNDIMPGDTIKFTFADNSVQIIQIGATGSYYIDSGMSIRKIEPGENFRSIGASMTYSYKSVQSNVFDKIEDVIVSEVSTHQFIGEHNIIQEIEQVWSDELQSWIKNPKADLIDIYGLTVCERQIEKLVKSEGKYFKDADATIEFDTTKADPFTIYAIGTWERTASGTIGNPTNPGYRPGYNALEFVTAGYMDFYNNKYYDGADGFNPKLQINNQLISVDELGLYYASKPGKLSVIELGNGVVAEMSYQIRNIDFRIEADKTYGDLVAARVAYDAAVSALEDYYMDLAEEAQVQFDEDQKAIANEAELPVINPMDDNSANECDALQENVRSTYTKLILALIKAQEEEKRAEGLL